VDALPEQHRARDFQAEEPYEVFLCNYSEHLPTGPEWHLEEGLVKTNRTEVCDRTHTMVMTPGQLQIPRRSREVDEFARQLSGIAKVRQEDHQSGATVYRYIKVRDDHYRHALNYFLLASHRAGLVLPKSVRVPRQEYAEGSYAVLG